VANKELIARAAKAIEQRRKELIAQPLARIYPQLAETAIEAVHSEVIDILLAIKNGPGLECIPDEEIQDKICLLLFDRLVGEKSE